MQAGHRLYDNVRKFGCCSMSRPYAGVAETHSGVVFFVGDRAYKLKKPVDLGFLDFTKRETREATCHREVELNRRLAPDVYLGVADLVGPDGEVEDHLVVMRRLPEGRRLSSLASARDPRVEGDIRRIARTLASFHSAARTGPDIELAGTSEATMARWEANAADIHRTCDGLLAPEHVSACVDLARRYLDGRAALFDRRISAGRMRDGHGDLLADDIFCLDDGPRILDCIEFDDRLRYGDVLSDVAFLAMDLESLGCPDLATELIGSYREHSGDNWPVSLQHHHIAYRAFVRAKVGALRAIQQGDGQASGPGRLMSMTLEHLDRGRVRMVLVGGVPGSGKSTVAAAVADALGAVLHSSDRIRKQLAGLDVDSPAAAGYRQGLYRPDATEATYDRLFDWANRSLAEGDSVVIDATFHDPAHRERARRAAEAAAADLDEVRCVAPQELIESRILERQAGRPQPSDASVSVARAMRDEETPWPSAVEVDTSRPIDESRAGLLGRLHIAAPAHLSTGP